jgi:hypothetical protein
LVVNRVLVFDEPAPPVRTSVIDELTSGLSPNELWDLVAAKRLGTPDPVKDPLIISGPVIVSPDFWSFVST